MKALCRRAEEVVQKTAKSDAHRTGWQVLDEVRAQIPESFPEPVAEAILNGLNVQAGQLGRRMSTNWKSSVPDLVRLSSRS